MTITGAQVWEAFYEYQDDDYTVRSTEITFLGSHLASDAASDAVRWWHNRHAAIPEWFGRVICIKIHRMTLQSVRADGYLDSSRGMCAGEWKIDFPVGLSDWPKMLRGREVLAGQKT